MKGESDLSETAYSKQKTSAVSEIFHMAKRHLSSPLEAGWSAAQLGKLKRTTLQDRIYSDLKRALMSGRFNPGDVLTLRSMAETLGTSIIPVRDALQRLVAERALNFRPRTRSAQVPLMTRREFDEMTAIRIRLEGFAVELAASRISSSGIAALEKLNDQLQAAIDNRDGSVALETNMSFHFTIYSSAESELLRDMIEAMWVRIGPLLAIPYREMLDQDNLTLEGFDGGIECHRQIIHRLRLRNSDDASASLIADIKTTASWYHEHYKFYE